MRFEQAWGPISFGWIIAVVVLIFAILMMASVVPVNAVTVGALLAAPAVARLT